jgi:biotin transporter BioY
MVAGSAVLYLCGLAWLAAYMGGDLGAAVRSGLRPFLLFDLAKVAVAAAVVAGCARLGAAGGGTWSRTTWR